MTKASIARPLALACKHRKLALLPRYVAAHNRTSRQRGRDPVTITPRHTNEMEHQ